MAKFILPHAVADCEERSRRGQLLGWGNDEIWLQLPRPWEHGTEPVAEELHQSHARQPVDQAISAIVAVGHEELVVCRRVGKLSNWTTPESSHNWQATNALRGAS